jgi:hypothetical protein
MHANDSDTGSIFVEVSRTWVVGPMTAGKPAVVSILNVDVRECGLTFGFFKLQLQGR